MAGDKFMPEMHLKQLGFIYSTCGPFTKNKERVQKIVQAEITDYIYNNDPNRACFQHGMAYGKYKDLTKRTQSGNVRDKYFMIASNPNYDLYQRELSSMVSKFFDKKSKGSGIKPMSNQQLVNELFRKLKRRKVYSSCKDNIWGVDLADMQLIRKFNRGSRDLLCVIDVFSKYT